MSDDLTSGLPPSYHLDLLSDPCVIILRRPGETVVARFTPFTDPKEIRRVAEEELPPLGLYQRMRCSSSIARTQLLLG